MDRRRAAGVLLALAACVAYATAAPTASNHTSLDLYDGAPDGCYYNFQHYGEGDRIMTNEPCLNCTCHNRMLMCYLRVCPFTKPIGQDCTIEKRADQCCPIVTCPDVPVDLLTSTTTSPAEYGATGLGKLDKYGCSIHGKYFPEGSKVPPTPNKPCEHCYCIRNMTTCVMQECTLHVDGCTPIYHKDVCCPVRYSCDHPEDEMPLLDDLSTTVRPTPGFLLTTTTISPVTQMSQDCLYENQIIPDGALIKTEKACDHCYCMKGDIVCVVQECGTPMENEGKNCTALVPREGVCCPDTYICEGDEPTTGSYEGIDFTTEIEQEKLTTVPHRRVESEGSGYRNEPDDITNTQSPAFDTEPEGSGDDQATIHPTFVTDVLPDSHKIETSDEISFSTEKINEYIHISTTKASIPVHEDITTESTKDTSELQQYVPSTSSTYISQQTDDQSTTKAQDEDMGSGEEDIVTPHQMIPSSSDLPVIEESEPTVSSEQNVATTESDKEADSETHVKEPTTSMPTAYEHQTTLPKDTDDSVVDITTETRPHLDEESPITEHVALETTTSVPIIKESERKTTVSEEKDTTVIPFESDTSKTFDQPATTSSPGLEDEIATTESQDAVTDSFEGTDFDPHSQITMTPSTPLLEEIEKETDEENIPIEGTSVEHKTSTTLSNIPTEEPVEKDSLKPDLIDETSLTNIPTSDSELENDDVTTAEPQKTQNTDIEESTEPEQYAPAIEDDMKKTTTLDAISTSEPQKSQDIDIKESSEPQQYAPTTRNPTFDDESKITTPSGALTSSEPHKVQSTDVESSEPQQHAPTTSAPTFDDESKKSTPLDAITTSEPQKAQETDVEENSEPQLYSSTTSAHLFDDESKKSTPSDAITTLKPQRAQEADVEESSESQHYAPTTSAPAFEDESKITTPSDAITSYEPQKTQVIDLEESSEPQQYAPTTSAPAFDDESKKSTPSDAITSSQSQKTQETDYEVSSEPQQYSPTTSAPEFDDQSKITTLSDSITTFEPQSSQKTPVEESSEPQHYVPTTKVPVFDVESKITTPSDALTTSEPQMAQETDIKESSEPQHYATTTYVPEFDDESKKSTLLDAITTSEPQQRPETDEKESSVSQQYTPITSAPIFDEEIKQTTPKDTITNTVFEDVDDHYEASSATTPEQSEITTAEPDKGLNTIPSGFIEDETTESPEVEKYTHTNDIITEPATEREIEVSVETESITDKSKPATITSDMSASQEDQFTLTTEATVKENVESIASTETHEFAKQTTVSANISEESSTKSPTSEYQEPDTSLEPLGTESVEQTADSKEPSSTQTTGPEDSFSEKYEIITSSPSTAIIPESTTANLEDNEIINEPRIPGEGDCLLNGVTYRNESTVPSTNKCQSGCRCTSSIIKCDPIICSPPPEYMDNCQTTYDSPDSCCPTYVCDHKTETMPPQSHSQMSGTEAPIVSPVKCNGDECILSGDKNQSVETPILCESGSCTSQDKTSSHPSYIPEQPVIDDHEGCKGDKCTPSDSSVQLCSKEKGCQASPVTPCEGNECEITPDAVLPQKQQPCADGVNCNIPVKDCSGDKCDLDADVSHKKPHEKICVNKEDCEDKLDIEKECTEKSCKRKDDSVLEQQPPKKCSGLDCQATELISKEELTTEADSLATSQKEMELEAQTKSTDNLETVTEKIKKSSELPAIELDHTTRPIEDKTEEPVQYKTTQSDHDSITKPLTTTILPDIKTQAPDLDSEKVEISTVRETATPNDKQDITESPVSLTPESTEVVDVEVNTESQTFSPAIYVTEKQDDMITKTSDGSDVSFDMDITTEIAEESSTHPPKTHSTEPQETTKLPLDIDKQETTTLVTKESENEPTKIHDLQENEDLADLTTNIPLKTDHTELSYKPTEVELTTMIADAITTVPSETSDIEPQAVTISSVGSQHEETTTKAYDLESQEVTKLLQENEDEGVPTNITEGIGSTPSETYDIDRQGTTEALRESQSEETTKKTVGGISTKSEITDMQVTTKTSEGTGSDGITEHSPEELTTESYKPYDFKEKDVTKLQEIDSEKATTSKTEDISTDTQSPNDTEVEKTTQASKEQASEEVVTKIPEQMVTETSKPYYIEIQEVTPPSDKLESVETTKKSDATEPSIFVNTEEHYPTKSQERFEVTTDVTDKTVKEPSKHDEIAHATTVPQQDTDTEATISNIKEETGTESSKLDEIEPFGTTKSSDDFNSEETTSTVTKIFDIEPPKSDDSESQAVTQSSEPDSITTSYITIESHSLEKSTTSQPDSVPQSTTPSILVPDSKSTEPERINDSEITTGIQEQSQPTESASESTDTATIASSETLVHKEDDMTSISDQDIITESSLGLTTKHEPHAEITPPSDKPSDGETMLPEIEISNFDKTVTELPKEQDTDMPNEEGKTTEAGVELIKITEKPVPTISTLDNDESQEDAKTEVPVLVETEEDKLSEATTSKPIDATAITYETDIKTEQPETTDSPKEEQTEDNATEQTFITEKATTEQTMEDLTTKLPVSLETVSESITKQPILPESLATEISKLVTTGKDEFETDAPFVNRPITLTPENEEKSTEIVKETETTQHSDKDTRPSESEEETYTKTPLYSTSEAADSEAAHIPEQSVGELTTPDIQIPESTEPTNIHMPNEITGSPELYTERPFTTTQKDLSGHVVTDRIEEESSTNQEDTGDKENELMAPEIPTVQESSTNDQPPTDMHKLSTESPKETYTEATGEKVTTEESLIMETEKVYESVTEAGQKVTKDTEIKTPEQDDFDLSQPTAPASTDQITKAQDQGNNENVEMATDKTAIKDSDVTSTSSALLKTTVAPETIETSTKHSEIVTSEPDGDIEKSPDLEHITTSKQENPETTTSAKMEHESISPVETESTGLPITSSDQHIVEIVTEPQAAPIDTTTTKQETVSESVEDVSPSRTERPEMYPTTSSTVDESEKSTPTPILVDKTSIAPAQTMLTSTEPHVSEGEEVTTVVLSAIDKASTPSMPEIVVQTETVTTPTELQPQPSPETSEPEEEKATTAKAEEITTASSVFDKITKPAHKPTEAPATEQPKPIPTEEQPTDDLLTPDEEPSMPPSGYGNDPDYMEEDQTFGPGTCRYGGKVYVSAQQIPRDDPCDFCFCFRSDIICLQQSCPPPIHGCHEEPISGFCCPRYECPVSMATTVNVTTTTTTTTTTLPPHFPVHSYKGSAQKRGCLIKGHTYKVGEVVRASSGPCLHCTCGGDGQMKCDPKQCTPEPMLRQMIAAAVSAKRRR